jgi:hypothetical protein
MMFLAPIFGFAISFDFTLGSLGFDARLHAFNEHIPPKPITCRWGAITDRLQTGTTDRRGSDS